MLLTVGSGSNGRLSQLPGRVEHGGGLQRRTVKGSNRRRAGGCTARVYQPGLKAGHPAGHIPGRHLVHLKAGRR